MRSQPISEQLLRLANGELPPEEAAAIRQKINESPEWKQAWSETQAMQSLLQSSVQAASEHALQPFFTDRLMRRLNNMEAGQSDVHEDDLARVLWAFFRPIAVAGLVVILGLILYNTNVASEYNIDASATEAVLALPPVSLESAFELDLATTYTSVDS